MIATASPGMTLAGIPESVTVGCEVSTGAVTVMVTVSAALSCSPSFTTSWKVSCTSVAFQPSVGAVKPGVAVVSPDRVTDVPPVWVQA